MAAVPPSGRSVWASRRRPKGRGQKPFNGDRVTEPAGIIRLCTESPPLVPGPRPRPSPPSRRATSSGGLAALTDALRPPAPGTSLLLSRHERPPRGRSTRRRDVLVPQLLCQALGAPRESQVRDLAAPRPSCGSSLSYAPTHCQAHSSRFARRVADQTAGAEELTFPPNPARWRDARSNPSRPPPCP